HAACRGSQHGLARIPSAPVGKPCRPRPCLLGLCLAEFAGVVPGGGRWPRRRAVLSQRESGAARGEPGGGGRGLLSSPYRAARLARGRAHLLLARRLRSAASLERAQHVIDRGNSEI